MLQPNTISFHFTRLGGYEADKVPDEAQMAELGMANIDEALRLISGVRPDVVLYGCTSATLTNGKKFDRELASRIRGLTCATSVTAAGAIAYALETLGVRTIGFASPYVGAINELAVGFLLECGFETAVLADIGRELGNYGQGQLTPEEVFELALQADGPEVEAIVLSCTDMRSVETVARLEDALDKPVVSSNQALLFQALRSLSLETGSINCGRLFRSA